MMSKLFNIINGGGDANSVDIRNFLECYPLINYHIFGYFFDCLLQIRSLIRDQIGVVVPFYNVPLPHLSGPHIQ